MKKILIILPFLLLAGCKFHYRYPCQDPANWDKEWCSNDVCKVDGTCTEKLIGFAPKPNQKISPEDLANTDGDENLVEPKKDISTDKPIDCKAPVVAKAKTTVAVAKKKTEPEVKIEKVVEKEEKIEEAQPKEMPLTMNTVVETNGHNQAVKN